MQKKFILLAVCCVLSTAVQAHIFSDSLELKQLHAAKSAHLLHRSFQQYSLLSKKATLDPIITPQQTLDDSTIYYRAKALEYHQEVNTRNAYVTSLNELTALELPVGVAPPNGDLNYAIIISQVKINPQGAFLEAYLMFELPNTGDKIAFRGKNIRFSHEGGLTGDGRLELVGDYPIRLSDQTLAWLLGKGNTFVEFDCNGFKGMGIEAEVQFSRDLIVPEDENGQVIPDQQERVKTKFSVQAQSWNDLMVGVNLPPFQVATLPGFGFRVQEAYLDWSDLSNPPGIVFPAGYTSPFLAANAPALWQGIYLHRLEVRLPASLKEKSTDKRTALGVQHMLLDDQGFTGFVFVEDEIIKGGDMSGWSFTLDKVNIELVVNQVKGFELGGRLTMPMVKTKDDKPAGFIYRAQRGADGQYIFGVTVADALRMPMLVAELSLRPGSGVTVREKDGKFYPTAILNGSLGIKGTSKGPKPSLAGIHFEGMRISSEEPRFDIQALGFGREGYQQNLSNFPVSITNIMVKKETNRVGLGFDLTINIGGKAEEGGFGGKAGLVVWAKQESQQLRDTEGKLTESAASNWQYDRVDLTGIGIKVSKPNVFQLDGMVKFFDEDPVYGEGFNGSITGSFGNMATTFQVFALFGKTTTYRYWYADALVKFKAGIPLIPGVLDATAFGGGYYHRMKQADQAISSTLGKAPSNITYVPNESSKGLRAIMEIATPRPELMNGVVALEIAMNNCGGFTNIRLTGNATFLGFQALAEDKVKELAGDAAAGKLSAKLAGMLAGQMVGSMLLNFDNVNDVFHGNIDVYVNVAGGVMRGVGTGNRAGWCTMHFEKGDWQILIGTPHQPLGLEMMRVIKTRAYLMAGNDLPAGPQPDPRVLEILGGKTIDGMRDANLLTSGTGMAFGLGFTVDTGDLRFLMFYGRFAAGAGIDFMLTNLGSHYHCAGSTGSMGINGWYAKGQAYAFVSGKVGIRVNLRFYKGNYDILNINAAAIMQAEGPNPFWMQGVVGGSYNILGGLVKGRCNFEVTVGERCIPVGEQELLAGVNMIAGITPTKGTEAVDVFNNPQVAFNIPVGQVFDITDLENKKHIFRAVLDEFVVKQDATVLAGELIWNEANDLVVFDGTEILPGKKKLNATARLSFEEKINGVWTKVKHEGKIVEEIISTDFTTDEAPDYIPDHNVLASYPIRQQFNFLPKEYNKGFIQLKDGQAYLFEQGADWEQKVRMTSTAGFVESSVRYDKSKKLVEFDIPTGFVNAQVYQWEILNMPTQIVRIDANLRKVETKMLSGGESTATLTTKTLEGNLDRKEVSVLFANAFRTSKYNTFQEKMKNTQLKPASRLSVDVNVFQLAAFITGDELWDLYDVTGVTGQKPLIELEAVTQGNEWYETTVFPLVYDGYPLSGFIRLRSRDPLLYGVPPIRNNYFALSKPLPRLQGSAEPVVYPFTQEFVLYNMGVTVYHDFRDLQNQVVNYVVDNPGVSNTRFQAMMVSNAPSLRYGAYRLKLSYKIPMLNITTSSYEWELFNKVVFNNN